MELTPSFQSYQSYHNKRHHSKHHYSTHHHHTTATTTHTAVEALPRRGTIPEELIRTEGLPESSHTVELTSSIQSHETYALEASPRHPPIPENIPEFSPKRPFKDPSAPVTAEGTGETDDLSGSVSERARSAVGELMLEYDFMSDAVAEGEYFIRIGKKNKGTSMGLHLGIVKNVALGRWTTGGLKVRGVKRGPVKEWNRSHPTMEVRPEDIIVEVNSVRGCGDALLEKIGDEMVLELRLLRPEEFERQAEPSSFHSDFSSPRSR